jgi:hypothetical protein
MNKIEKAFIHTPKAIINNIEKLNKLVEDNPLYLPVTDVACLLGMGAENLRACLEQRSCPFGFSWQKTLKGYHSFKIPTVPFYMWYTQGILDRGKS